MVLQHNIYVTELWNDLFDFIKKNITYFFIIQKSISSRIQEFFSKTPNDLYHFGAHRCNLIHCKLRNCSSDLYKDLFDHYLYDSPACKNCDCKTEDSFQYFFKMSSI